MFNFFRKKPRKYPAFERLQQSNYKDKYFIRLKEWDWLNNEMIHVFDPKLGRMVTMDIWLQIVYLEANGQLTVSEIVYKKADMYTRKEGIPEELDTTILSMVESLEEEGLIEIMDEPRSIPYHLSVPLSKQKKE